MILGDIKSKLRKTDWVLWGAVLLLTAIGLTAIYSVSLGSDPIDYSSFKKQIVIFVFALLIALVVSFLNYSIFRMYSRYLYWGSVLLLLGVLFFGVTINGTTGWFNVFGFNFQPVELAKLALVLFLAKFFSNRYQQFNEARHIIVSFVGTMILTFLVLMQPDAGSALVLLGLWFLLLTVSGVKWRYIITLVLILSVATLFLWGFVFQDYQKERVHNFINPQLDPLGSGYNVTQAIIAVGSGGLWGRGLGFGSQSQLKFIPESQTDFIFAVIAEELGLLGVTLVLSLWFVIFYRLLKAAKQAPDDFGMYLLLGIAVVFLIHLIVNIGMNIGVLPVTGISLPFLSSGGSFLMTSVFMIGMAQSVIIRR